MVLMPACGSGPPRAGDEASRLAAPVPVPADQVAPPPGVDAQAVQPAESDAARMTLEQVLADVDWPEYLGPYTRPLSLAPRAPLAFPGEPVPDPEPPLAAQRAYVSARLAMQDDRHFDAVRHLNEALEHDPDAVAVHRLLGAAALAAGNEQLAVESLHYVVGRASLDNQSRLLLAERALRAGRHDEAIALLLQVVRNELTNPDPDPAIQPLTHYLLGSTLRARGHIAAAAEQLRAYLQMPQRYTRNSPSARELYVINRRRPVTLTALGDLMLQLDDVPAARSAYRKAGRDLAREPVALVARRAYVALRSGTPEDAVELAVQQLEARGAQDTSLDLLRWVVEQGGDPAHLTDRLTAMYRDDGRPAELVVALADLLPTRDAAALLTDHLVHTPDDEAVHDRLLTLLLGDAVDPGQTASTRVDPERLATALDATVQVMQASPVLASRYGSALVRRTQPEQLLDAIHTSWPIADVAADSPPGDAGYPQALVLRAAAMYRQEQIDEALTLLAEQLDAHGGAGWDPVRLELARVAVVREQWDAALDRLDELDQPELRPAVLLAVRALSGAGDSDAAYERLSDALEQQRPEDTESARRYATLLMQLERPGEAEQLLLDALNADAQNELLYADLFAIYDQNASMVPNYQRLMRRMLETIPTSRIARLKLAELYEARGEFDRAEALLQPLLAETPDDVAVMIGLLKVYLRADRSDDARSLMARALDRAPEDPQLLRLASQFYERIGDETRQYEVLARLLEQEPANARRDRTLIAIYAQLQRWDRLVPMLQDMLNQPQVDQPVMVAGQLWRALLELDRADQAQAMLEAAIDRFPEHAADLGYELTVLLERSGEGDAGWALSQRLVEEYPQHGPLNNSVGYGLARRGEDLLRARRLVQRALATSPNSAAYLDSLGWVYYKMGQFDQALQWLRRAADAPGGDHPVIVDHLADAYYQLGEVQTARATWELAAARLEHMDAADLAEDPETATLGERLEAKLAALAADQPVPVAQPAGPDGLGEGPGPLLPGEIDAAFDAARGLIEQVVE
jgi:tetratricopeptide (TPR) repeat protein